MQNVLGVWAGLNTRRKAIVIAATLAMFATVLALSQIVTSTRMDLLYAGLETRAAGEVVAALEQEGVAYEVRGTSIYVDASRRDALRMVLASQGLPANGAAGYELLDTLTGFGTTAQMFDAAYWRAKEGELARTIQSSPQVRAARVHISTPPASGFRRDAGATASVVVTPAGVPLSEANGRALRYLVASAVPGLRPENVSVIDGESGVVLGGEETPSVESAKREAALKHNVERLLEARVGPGNAIVEVSLEAVTERESIVETRFDPEGRVAISTETEERSSSSRDARGGGVTVASNLPDGDAGSGGGQQAEQDSETLERVNFEVSETQREILRVPGAVKRITVAVLVNAVPQTGDAGGATVAPRSEEELADLRSLIEAAVGFDEARGDRVTIRSLEFQPVSPSGSGPAGGMLDGLDLLSLAQIAVLAVVALILGLFVVRPIMTNRSAPQMLELAQPPKISKASAVEGAADAPDAALTGEIDSGDDENGLPDIGGFGGNMAGGLPMQPMESNDPVDRLRQLIRDRQQETVEVLKSWMEDDKESVK
ncbi:flagellar basal-body MS-ring/collar protein FliF [Tropicimonas sp. IMCC6043]|uniref:flagellar basal-body MS-ring/collar protein FliF n=1 Tax=Tropicimonas sp. IMCC6043 TaxID=2510645 RepID=UPI00101E03F3|nr:flagellar basal-body MS-ring/collar protein FliF [Tropicimonas sp. IMCC6043]RYH10117.1 flagellar M-ring protein FliF [Tropicimonas sp. IMCC6043]